MYLRLPARASGEQEEEVNGMTKKGNCGCGCVPPGKTEEQQVKTIKSKSSKKK